MHIFDHPCAHHGNSLLARWTRRLCVLPVFLVLALAANAAAPWPTAEWPRSTPAAQGIDPRALLALHEELAKPVYEVDSVLVIRNGYLVSEANFAPYAPHFVHDLRSVTKSITGTLIGVAIQQGKIRNLEQPALSFFPQYHAQSTWQGRINLAHLLEMRSGLRWREAPYDAESDVIRMAASPDWVAYILKQPVQEMPGVRFHYSGAAPHLLSAILTRATGQNALDYARAHLFGPLGILDATWRTDPQGNANGESGLSLRPRDLAKIGLLYLRNGVWDGRRLLPAWFVPRIFNASTPHRLLFTGGLPPNYSALWWVDPQVPLALASGRHGQHLVLLPRHDLILVINAKTPETQPLRIDVERLVTGVLLRGLSHGPLALSAADPPVQLEQKLSALTREVPLAGLATPALAQRVTAHTYRFESNRLGLMGLSLQPGPNRRALLSTTWSSPNSPNGVMRLDLPYGTDGLYVMSGPTPLGVYASRGAWRDARTLLVETEAPANSVGTAMRMAFGPDGRTVALTLTDGAGLNVTVNGRAQ